MGVTVCHTISAVAHTLPANLLWDIKGSIAVAAV